MIVHSMDAPKVFPYKRPQMEKVFRAFQAMLRKKSVRFQTCDVPLSASE
jgi:hypothetical protein